MPGNRAVWLSVAESPRCITFVKDAYSRLGPCSPGVQLPRAHTLSPPRKWWTLAPLPHGAAPGFGKTLSGVQRACWSSVTGIFFICGVLNTPCPCVRSFLNRRTPLWNLSYARAHVVRGRKPGVSLLAAWYPCFKRGDAAPPRHRHPCF